MKNSFYLVSLGCAKNTVDSESMATVLLRAGFTAVEQPSKAEFLIVNTCGFIESARLESISVLEELAVGKKKSQYLIAAGCMTERHRVSIIENVRGIDGIIGTKRWMDILDVVKKTRSGVEAQPYEHFPDCVSVGTDEGQIPRFAIQGGSAYLKIADGCRRPCAFCSIPLIKGPTVSRPMATILQEAKTLARNGIQEIILISQDTTGYGSDIGLKNGLAALLSKLTLEVPEVPWIRFLYTFPGYINDSLIELMAQSRQILHYLDIPLQHAHPQVLRRMRRPSNMDWTYRTIEKMRQAIPDLAIRSTFIVGYPGETDQEFQTLLDFIQEVQLDHVGCFMYSHEEGTRSASLEDDVPLPLKQERLEQLMLVQQDISLSHNQKLIGKTLPVIIEGMDKGIVIGRSYRDAPEIDGLVFAEGQAEIGSIVPVRINGAMPHDLMGVVVK